MNRQQRRRNARRGILDPETGTVATSTGHTFTPTTVVDIPPKVPGRHRWILSCGFTVTDNQAAVAHEGVKQVLMGVDNVLSYGIGCWDCEGIYREVFTTPCPR